MTDAQIDQLLRDMHALEMTAGRCDSGLATSDDGDSLRDIAERLTACLQWRRRERVNPLAAIEALDGG